MPTFDHQTPYHPQNNRLDRWKRDEALNSFLWWDRAICWSAAIALSLVIGLSVWQQWPTTTNCCTTVTSIVHR